MVCELVPASKNVEHNVFDIISVYITVFQTLLDFCSLKVQLDF
jgi:hypothetical protein